MSVKRFRQSFDVSYKITIPEERVAELLQEGWGHDTWWSCVTAPFERDDDGLMYLRQTEYVACGLPITLTIDKIRSGLAIFASKYRHDFENFLAENEDVETADVFLQCCLLER